MPSFGIMLPRIVYAAAVYDQAFIGSWDFLDPVVVPANNWPVAIVTTIVRDRPEASTDNLLLSVFEKPRCGQCG
jgi:hypothetical protein